LAIRQSTTADRWERWGLALIWQGTVLIAGSTGLTLTFCVGMPPIAPNVQECDARDDATEG